MDAVAEAAARASELDLGRASSDPAFQIVSSLLVQLPLLARVPGFEDAICNLWLNAEALGSMSALLAGLSESIGRKVFEHGRSSDAGEIARSALLESLSVQLHDQLPSLFEPSPSDIRQALASFSSGQNFARLARDFFAKLPYKWLDYYLSRELANHTGSGKRFTTGADRVEFQRDLSQYTFEAWRIVEEFAGGLVWKKRFGRSKT